MSLPLEITEALAIGLVFGWLFCLGATVGSFLNVVVWRLPRGQSLVHPGSQCPVCHAPIRLADNIPVLSWLALRGRCRDCGAPIAVRYLLVELATGSLFLALAAWRTIGPAAHPRSLDPRWLLSWELAGSFWIDYLRDVILLSSLLAASLIEADSFAVPWHLWWPSGVMAILHPSIRLLFGPTAIPGTGEKAWEGLAGGWGTLLIGPCLDLAVGLVVGGGLQRVRQLAAGHKLLDLPLGFALGVTAASLGWLAMLWAACGGMVLLVAGRLTGRDIPTAAAVGMLVVAEILGSDRLVRMGEAWVGWTTLWSAALCAALALGAAGLLGRLERSLPPPAEPSSAPPPPLAASAPPPSEPEA